MESSSTHASRCNLAACRIAHYAPPNVSAHVCAQLSSMAVNRAITVRQVPVQLGLRLHAATAKRPLIVAAIGGSVSAGPAGRSWLEHMRDEYFPNAWSTNISQTGAVRFYKLATNAMGPSYMSRCLLRHKQAFGGQVPDVVIAEYAVNDGEAMDNRPATEMRSLASMLKDLGITLILLHHFAPAFILGGSTYHGHRYTGERVHEQLASEVGLTTASLLKATGLPSAWSPATMPALTECELACAFQLDNVHPNPCGQRFLAQIATRAIIQVLGTAHARRSAAAAAAAEKAPRNRVFPTAKCWSLVGNGSEADRNLIASQATGWEVVNLKKQPVHDMVRNVYKFVYLTGRPNSQITFQGIGCTERERVRIFYIAGETMNLGRARVEIDGQPAATPAGLSYMSGYLRGQGSLFMSTDFMMPLIPRRRHTVTVVALNETDNPRSPHRFGFAINAIVCV